MSISRRLLVEQTMTSRAQPVISSSLTKHKTPMQTPVAGINLWRAMAASAAEIQVYDTQGGRLRYVTQVVGIGAEPIAVLATLRTNEFIVAHADGHLLVYRIE